MIYPLIPNKIKSIKLPDYQRANSVFKTGDIYNQRISYLLNGDLISLEHKINHNDLKTLLDFYISVFGCVKSFTLPENFYKMPDLITDTLDNLNPYQKFKFTQPVIFNPIVATTIRGWYQVDVELKMVFR